MNVVNVLKQTVKLINWAKQRSCTVRGTTCLETGVGCRYELLELLVSRWVRRHVTARHASLAHAPRSTCARATGQRRHPLHCIVSPLSLSRRGYRPSDNLHSANRY
ncbi:hypothetical protein B5X24_HaOG217116 [Helicoverpa armigera]|uniref:Uncharacterized protein n=1 Tax=Helicoverpa armigera TaxID=29058 RepID=A0A2W1C101_HELAM|nr:hypothetical protein B5X24_HaOG217116 [Helicoverpa armigera]